MAHFFSYDSGANKHRISAFPLQNEMGKVVAYLPVVDRYPSEGGLVENVSFNLVDLRLKCFSTELLAREYAIEYFKQLESEEDIKRGYLRKGNWDACLRSSNQV